MTSCKHQRVLKVLSLCAVLLMVSCTDAGLYKWQTTPYQANKLTVSGNVCTDDLHQTDFPVKVLFVVDVSLAVQASNNDSNGYRGKGIEEVLGLWGKNPNYQFGMIVYGARAKNLLVDAAGKPISFTRDTSKLSEAAKQVMSGAGFTDISACRSGRCRDYRAAVGLASSVITGDVLATDPGEVARTTYAVIMFAGGGPVPALGRCACRNLDDEKAGGKWEGCPWVECDDCFVSCPPKTQCKGTTCLPICEPECEDNEYCDSTKDPWVCTEGTPATLPTVDPLSSLPQVVPDTFIAQTPPPASPGACKPSTCVYAAGGNPDSCEEKVIVLDVRELKDFVMKNGAGQFQFHTTYLPDNEPRQDPKDLYYPQPPCDGDTKAEDARAVRLLSQMAYAGNGGFSKFAAAGQIPGGFVDVGKDLYKSADALVFKELVVTNANVLAEADGISPDTDADGLSDPIEKKLGICLSDPDSDGDGIGDGVEVKLAMDPLKKNEPVECVDLPNTLEDGDDPCDPTQSKSRKRYTENKDNDALNACEERLLGTDDSLFDTDADGIPDEVEFVMGTNYLAVDPLGDADLDGIVNREEIRGHTDPRSNDAHSQLDLGYRYEEVDEGLQDVRAFSELTQITGVTIKNGSPATSPGVGQLKFSPGPPPTLAWRDYSDMKSGGDFGPAVDISKPVRDGYKLTSCRKQEIGGKQGCTEESQLRYLTVAVDGPDSYGAKDLVEKVIVSSGMRNCVRFTVRNITLLETGRDPILGTVGDNNVKIYFAEAPQRAKTGNGIFRIANLRLTYLKGPPEQRTPKAAEITFANEDFVLDIAK